MNSCNFVGNLGRDWEISYSKDGKAVAKNSLAVKKYKDGTNWLPLVAFGARGENLEKYTNKGSQLAVQCEVDINPYEKDGEKKTFTSFIVNQFTFIGSKGGDNQGGGGGQGGYNPNSQQGGQSGGYQQGGYPEQNQAGHQRQVHGGYQQSQNSQQQTQNQGVYQQQGGGQGENYPQPPDDNIPF